MRKLRRMAWREVRNEPTAAVCLFTGAIPRGRDQSRFAVDFTGAPSWSRRLMRRIICILALPALAVLLVACQQRSDFVAPKAASSAVAAAKMYLKTNGIMEQPILQAAEFEQPVLQAEGFEHGVWRLELVSARSKKGDLDCWIIRASPDGQIVFTYGPH